MQEMEGQWGCPGQLLQPCSLDDLLWLNSSMSVRMLIICDLQGEKQADAINSCLGPLSSSGRENKTLFHNLWVHLASHWIGKVTNGPLRDQCIRVLFSPLPLVHTCSGAPSEDKATAPYCMCLEALDVWEPGDVETHAILIPLWSDQMEINKHEA